MFSFSTPTKTRSVLAALMVEVSGTGMETPMSEVGAVGVTASAIEDEDAEDGVAAKKGAATAVAEEVGASGPEDETTTRAATEEEDAEEGAAAAEEDEVEAPGPEDESTMGVVLLSRTAVWCTGFFCFFRLFRALPAVGTRAGYRFS